MTKGEWYEDGERVFVYDDEGLDGVFTIAKVDGKTFEEQEANARLIATAPKMYLLLRTLTDDLNRIIDDPEDYRCRELLEAYELLACIEGKETE